MAVPFIAVEGPIGVGKTTLTRAIAETFHFVRLEEVVEGNPFLKAFYQDIERTAFQTEMFFLTDRFHQLERVQHLLNNGKPVVSDYHIFKNKLFANQTLKHEHKEKFNQIYDILTADFTKPNIVIYLKASMENLLKRIAKRGRPEEVYLTGEYLSRIVTAYEDWMPKFAELHKDTKVLTIETDSVNFAENEDDLHVFLDKLNHILKEELHYA
ncbi:MAG: deoxynucleoside kinase [Tuberibacillus sp.]